MDYDKKLKEIQNRRRRQRQTQAESNRPSKLDRHREELTNLRIAGASLRDLEYWLITEKGMSAHHDTINDRLKVWGVRKGR